MNIEQLNADVAEHTIRCLIGAGDFGEAYLATGIVSDKIVAIKFFTNDLLEQPDLERSFIHYVGNYTQRNHRNVVNILEVNKTNSGLLYIAIDSKEGHGFISGKNGADFQQQAIEMQESLAKSPDSNRLMKCGSMSDFINVLQAMQGNTYDKGIEPTLVSNEVLQIPVIKRYENNSVRPLSSKKERRETKQSLYSSKRFTSVLPIIAISVLILGTIIYLVNLGIESKKDELELALEIEKTKLVKQEREDEARDLTSKAEKVVPEIVSVENDAEAEVKAEAEELVIPEVKESPVISEITPEKDEPKEEENTVKLGVTEKPYEIEPNSSAIDLIIRKGWINTATNKALIILNFGTNSEMDSKIAASRLEDINSMLMNSIAPVTFQCAYSINDQWDELKPGGERYPDAELTMGEDIAAGGFNTKWFGVIAPDEAMLTKGIQMKHVFQIDLSNEQIMSKAKFILVKINYGKSRAESDYTNNVIALPISSEEVWTEIRHQ